MSTLAKVFSHKGVNDYELFQDRCRKMIVLDLNRNYAEALLHHAKAFQPASGDPREDMRLRDALDDLVEAIEQHFNEPPTHCA